MDAAEGVSPAPRLLLSVQQAGGVRVIGAAGEVDLATADSLADALRLRHGERVDVIVDLSRTTFLDCTGARVLFDAAQAVRDAGRGFAVAHRSDDVVARMLSLMATAGLELPVYPSLGAAVAALGPRRPSHATRLGAHAQT